MGAVNLTVRVDEKTKREFDAFCEDVGMSMTTAFNLFMKTVLREGQLPFTITNVAAHEQTKARQALLQAFNEAQQQSVMNGTDKMTMEEIDAEIAAYRGEKRRQLCR